jgi:hypothetical protein
MTALKTTSRTLIALFAAMALMLVIVLAAFSATSSDHGAATWNHAPAGGTWNTVSAAATWHAKTAAATWH